MTPRRRPGRPPLCDADPSVKYTVCLPSKQFDALYARAHAARLTMAEFIRCQLRVPPKADLSQP